MFHHGSFNPRFLGITLRFQSPEISHVFRDSILGGGDIDYSAMRDEALGVVGVLDHESKHYHDSLLSSFASNIFWLRLSYFVNGFQALQNLEHLDGDALFFSIKEWLQTPPLDREIISGALGTKPDDDQPTIVELPYFNEEEWGAFSHRVAHNEGPLDKHPRLKQFLMHVNASCNAHNQLVKMMIGHDRHELFTTRNVFEMGAYAVQAEAIRANGSLQLASRFVDRVFREDHQPARLSRFITSLWHDVVQGPSTSYCVDHELANVIGTWALLGDYYQDSRAAFPANRLLSLVNLWRQNPSAAGEVGMPPSHLWDLWDHHLGINGWREAMKHLVSGTQRRVHRYRDLMTNFGGLGPKLVFIAELYAQDQRHAVERLLADPDTFGSASHYIYSPWGKALMPPATVHKNIGFLELMDQADYQGRVRLYGHNSVSNQIAVHRAVIITRDSLPSSALDTFAFFDEVGRAVDLIIAGERVEDEEYAEVGRIVQDQFGKTLLRA